MTLLSLIAGLLYCLVGGTAFALATRRLGQRQSPAARVHWWLVTLLFAGLALWRFTQGEALLQDDVREWTRLHGVYNDRHEWQIPVTIGLILIGVALLWLLMTPTRYRWSRRALILAVTLCLYSVARLISLHAIDAIIYRSFGPVHVNYLIDLGLTAGTLALTLCEVMRVGDKAPDRPRSNSRGTRRRRSRS